MPLFHEMYGGYYRAVAAILQKGLTGPVTKADMIALCDRYARGESALTIPEPLQSGQWPLMDGEGRSLVKNAPTMPLTLLERRWLKAVSLDPRVGLFDVDFSFLGEVNPLFRPEDVIAFDRYGDGDDYADPAYAACFRAALTAIREGRLVFLRYEGPRGKVVERRAAPMRLEYSEKDDCFRLICRDRQGTTIYRMGRIRQVRLLGERPFRQEEETEAKQAVLEITDDRAALERVSMHFAHLRKTVERTAAGDYRMTLWYDPLDETEMVIRVLQFGPVVKAVAPDPFVDEVKLRLKRQLALAGKP